MTRETYRLVEKTHPLYIINYIFFLHPCIHLPIIPTHSLSCICLLFHITLIYLIISFSVITSHIIPFYYFIFNRSLDILQPLSIFLFLLHIKCIQITHASLFLLVHNHTYSHRTSVSSFHSLLRCPPSCKQHKLRLIYCVSHYLADMF